MALLMELTNDVLIIIIVRVRRPTLKIINAGQ